MTPFQYKAVEAISFKDIQDYCAEQVKENIGIDYKEGFSKTDAGLQIAKLVAAFANTQGGMIIYGVRQSADRTPEACPDGQELGDDARNRVFKSIARIYPSPQIDVSEFLRNPKDEKRGFLVIKVPASPEAPHVMEDGRTVYERVADMSEPKLITLTRLEFMLERRRTRLSLQTGRISRGIDRLCRAIGSVSSGKNRNTLSEAFIAVSVGPTISEIPIVDFNLLVPKLIMRDGLPEHLIERAADSWYFTEGGEGYLFDAFGNSIVVFTDQELIQEFKDISRRCHPWVLETAEAREAKSIHVTSILKPLAFAIEGTRKYCEEHGFYGSLSLTVQARNLLHHILAYSSQSRTEVLGSSRTDKHAEFSFDFFSSAISHENAEIGVRAASKLFEAWNCKPEKAAFASFFDQAERSVFGEYPCPGHGQHHRNPHWVVPGNRERCLICRSRPKEIDGSAS